MKKLLLSIMFISVAISGLFAQKMNVTSAYTYLGKGYLDKAKDAIDKAILSEETKNDPKTWLYRGYIYLNISKSDKEKYLALKPGSLDTAYSSLMKTYMLDTQKEYNQDLGKALLDCSYSFFNRGVEFFVGKNYTSAFLAFNTTTDIRELTRFIDADYMQALTNAILAYDNINEDKSAFDENIKNKLKYLIMLKDTTPNPYKKYSDILLKEKDTVAALNVIKEGRIITNDNLELIIAEANIYLSQKKEDLAKNTLELALQKDPNNPIIHSAVAEKYAASGNIEKAELEYNKAIQLKPDYFDAYYNLGIMYMNKAVDLTDEANKLPLGDKKYDVLKAQADSYFDKAIPHLEKAESINPNDFDTLKSLKQLYAKKTNVEGLKRVNSKLNQQEKK